jgi:AcrR family transcriptional regulator
MGKGDETRERILRRALAMVSKEGLDGLSIGHLANEVGMSKSGLFAHFGSKEELQLGVLDTAVETFFSSVIAPALRAPRGIPRLEDFFDRWVTWERSPELPGGCPFIAMAHELDDHPGALRDRLVAYQRDWIDALATAARIAVDEEQFQSDLDTAQFAYDFYSIILSYHYFSRLMRDANAENQARTAFRRLLDQARDPSRDPSRARAQI